MEEFQTIILRFRDLVTENDITIEKHQEVIAEKKHVWWGWWKKGNETIPYSELCALKGRVLSEPEYVYLMDSGQEKLYKAKCSDISCFRDGKGESPEQEATPAYYNAEFYYAWFRFEEIKECSVNEVKQYTYIRVDSLFVGGHSNYEKFYGKRIYDVKELIQQNRTLWFIRKYNEKEDSDYEIRLLDAVVVEPYHFSRKYYETASNTLLWLSDLHFGGNKAVQVKAKHETDVTLSRHMNNAYGDLEKLGGLIITGDITSWGEAEGFEMAREFITDLNRYLDQKLTSDNIIFCPGNHDLARKNSTVKRKVPEEVWDNSDSTEAYARFYNLIHNITPNPYMACGRKLLMQSGRTVEIAALNSLILQQYKDFEGHGFISDKQLEYTAKHMGWKEYDETSAVRIVMMHHHYLPTCLTEKVDVKKASSVVYDADRLMSWMVKHNVKLLLHGHKHRSFFARVGYPDQSKGELVADKLKDIYVVGMGGTGAPDCENKFGVLNFKSHEIELKYFRVYFDNIQEDHELQTIHIPI